MAKTEPQYRLTPAALSDLESIWLYTRDRWTADQADSYVEALQATFDTLLTMPQIARERREFSPPVRIHPSAGHVVIYVTTGHGLTILRVLGRRQNWQAILDDDA
ncbi:hypothetical protein LCGC14_2465040, partial [marine sediment metagenome]